MKADEFLANKGIYHNINYPTDDGHITLTKLLDEYAQHVAVDFAHQVATDPLGDQIPESILLGFFNKWYTNHQTQQ